MIEQKAAAEAALPNRRRGVMCVPTVPRIQLTSKRIRVSVVLLSKLEWELVRIRLRIRYSYAVINKLRAIVRVRIS
jgi:hypothetical protein